MIPEETGRFLGRIAMDGPGEYLPDVTEGITRVEARRNLLGAR